MIVDILVEDYFCAETGEVSLCLFSNIWAGL